MSRQKVIGQKNMPTPDLGFKTDPDAWWQKPSWQPGTPRPFQSQHNFGQLEPQKKPESTPNYHLKKNFDGKQCNSIGSIILKVK